MHAYVLEMAFTQLPYDEHYSTIELFFNLNKPFSPVIDANK